MKPCRPKATSIALGRQLKALLLENDWLSTTVLLDQGADLYTLIYKPRNIDVLFKSPLKVREPGVGPVTGGDSFTSWVDHYRGGWQVIFPNFGPAVKHKGVILDFHGEAARTPWEIEEIRETEDGLTVTMGVTLTKSPFQIRRVLSLATAQPVLEIEETVTNFGLEPMACVWAHHPAFGPPFLSGECLIDTGAQAIESDDNYDVGGNDLPTAREWKWPWIFNQQGEKVDLSKGLPSGSGVSRVLFLKDFTRGWYSVTNPHLGFGIGMVWNEQLFPYCCFWQETGGVRDYPWYGRGYALAIEPSSSYPGQGLSAIMEKTKTHLTFAPGESRTLYLKAVLFEGTSRVTGINSAGVVSFATGSDG